MQAVRLPVLPVIGFTFVSFYPAGVYKREAMQRCMDMP